MGKKNTRTQFDSSLQRRLYHCKNCNSLNTEFQTFDNELRCFDCGYETIYSASDIEFSNKMRRKEIKKKRNRFRKMTKVDKMKQLTHMVSPSGDTFCGITNLKNKKIVTSHGELTCKRCKLNI